MQKKFFIVYEPQHIFICTDLGLNGPYHNDQGLSFVTVIADSFVSNIRCALKGDWFDFSRAPSNLRLAYTATNK